MLDLGLLLAQLVVVLAAARLAGLLVRPLGQPAVVGEMLAGLALGPSLLGAVAPGAMRALFPPDALVPLATLSQLGVLLYMFVVGLRLDLGALHGRARTAVAVSHASIVLPLALGAGLAPLLHPAFAPPGVALPPFALFLGAAMSVTAFPVLARILEERGLAGTRLGTIAIAAAAVDDATAWCILAAVVAVAGGPTTGAAAALRAILLAAGWALLLVLVARPLLARLAAARRAGDRPASATVVSLAVVAALVSALVTEWIGVHALFGAFLAGVAVPRVGARHGLATAIADRIEAVVGAVLLPVFFAFTGLRASVGLLDGAEAWTAAGLVLLAAVVGKVGGSAGAARLLRMGWRDALAVGALMNTRGLMELVIASVGLEIGVISPALFTMLVLMALATTAMTSPLLALLRPGTDAAPPDPASPGAPTGAAR